MSYEIEFKGGYLGIREMRKHVAGIRKVCLVLGKLRDESTRWPTKSWKRFWMKK